MIFSFSRIVIAENSWNDSTQSPACSRKARPSATFASDSRSARASPAKTSGGIAASRTRTASARSTLGHSGCCAAWASRHDDADHVLRVTAMGLSVEPPFHGSAPLALAPSPAREKDLGRRQKLSAPEGLTLAV